MRLAIALILLLPFYIEAQTLEDLSKLPKPTPVWQKNDDWCPKGGDGDDTELSLVKNRIDIPKAVKAYHAVDFDEVLTKDYKAGTTGPRNTPGKDVSSIHKYEGIPIVLQGFLRYTKEGSKSVGAIQEGAEACNCHRPKADFEHVDYHLWLVKKPSDPLGKAVVVEMTPRIRAKMKGRAMKEDQLESDLNFLAANKIPVKIFGWLMFDGEHVGQLPGHAKVRRGTLWEIHPITSIYTFQDNKWQKLY